MKSYIVKQAIEDTFEAIADYRSINKDRFTANEGLYFCVQISSHCHGYERDGNTHHSEWEGRSNWAWHVIILRNRNVFTAWTQDYNPRDGLPAPDKWTNKSNHDSCWRSTLDELTQFGRAVVDQAWENVPKDEIYPQSYDDRVDFKLSTGWLSGPTFKVVKVDKQVIDPHKSYFKRLTSIELIQKEILV